MEEMADAQPSVSGGVSMLFGTPVWVASLPAAEVVNSRISETVDADLHSGKIKVATTSSLGRNRQEEVGEITGEISVIERHQYLDLTDEVYQPLATFINDCMKGIIREGSSWSIRAWLNTQPPGEYNNQHLHSGGCLFSGVYYVSVPPGAGALVLHDPRSVATYTGFNQYCKLKLDPVALKYLPSEGSIIIFPSWLEHSVERNEGNSTRISIAFNVYIS